MTIPFRPLAGALAALTLAACGGGGSSPAASPPAPPPPAPAPPPFAFNAANALDASGFVMHAMEEAGAVAEYPLIIADWLTQAGVPEATSYCDGITPIRMRHVDVDGNRMLSRGDLLQLERPQCGGIAADISFTVDTSTVQPFASSMGELSGSGTFDVRRANPSLRVHGTFDLTTTRSGNVTLWLVEQLAATVESGGTVETIANGVLDGGINAASLAYRYTFSGSVTSEKLGTSFDFATLAPFDGTHGSFPAAGELLLTAGASRLRIVPSVILPARHADVSIDAAGAGFEPPMQAEWTAFMRGALFGWYPNEPPVITSLQIDPPNPTKASFLAAVYDVSDPDRNAVQISFEWRRNGSLIANAPFPTLSSDNFAKGDVVEVTLIASDGRASTRRTAVTTIGNAAPQLTNGQITPDLPDTTSDLTFAGLASDLDDDTVTISYVWRRNGVVIPSATASVLPASATERSDVISVVASASDGEASTTAEASVTIVDAPPQISITGAPASADYGDLVTFTAEVIDPDGDPVEQVELRLAGPAGMTLDQASGQIAWLAQPPMFDRTMTVHWSVAIAGPNGRSTGGSVLVQDPAREYPLMRTGLQIPTWPAGLSIGDFDSDGDEEMLILGTRSLFELEHDGTGGYRESWMYPFSLGQETTPNFYNQSNLKALATADVDADGRAELFVAAGSHVARIDGAERRLVASVNIGDYRACRDLQVANLDGIGAAEVVCLVDTGAYGMSGLLVLNADLSERWEFADASYGLSIDLGNVDADAALEIVTSGGFVFDGVSFASEWSYPPGFGVDVDTGDLDGDGIAEIVGAADWEAVRGFSATLRSPIWEVGRTDLESVLVTNIDGDASAEILVGDGQWGEVTAYEYDAGTNTVSVLFQIDSQDHGVSALGVGDVDGDGALEIVWGTGGSSSGADRLIVAGRNPDIEVEWTNTDPEEIDGPFSGGELAGSTLAAPEPLFATPRSDSGYEGTRLIRMHPVTGDLAISNEVGDNGQGSAPVTVADYDNDGTDEAFLGTSTFYDGQIAAYDSFANALEWMQPSQSIRALVDVDLTNDGHPDLAAISTNGIVYIYDVFSQTLVWQSTQLGSGRDVIVADLDGDGAQDIVAVTADRVYVYERVAGPVTYAQSGIYTPSHPVRDAVVADTDGDGACEVFVLTGPDYLFDTTSRVERVDASLQRIGYFDVPWRSTSVFVEPSAGSHTNLILPTSSFAGPPSEIVAVDSIDGSEIWRSPMLIGQITDDSLHFVQIGGATRLAFGTSRGMYLTR